jgi:thioredoxin-related protein
MAQTENQRKVSSVLLAVALILIGARVAWHFAPSRGNADALVKWVPLEDAQNLAAMSKRPILIHFTAEWCGPCHVLDAEVFRDPVLAEEINERFVPVRVTDRQREEGKNSGPVSDVQQHFGVKGFPTLVVADWNGVERARMEGYGGRERFRRMMESVR